MRYIKYCTLLLFIVFYNVSYSEILVNETFDDISDWNTNDEYPQAECSVGECAGTMPGTFTAYRNVKGDPSLSPVITIQQPPVGGDHTTGSGKVARIFQESVDGVNWPGDGILMHPLGGDYQEVYIDFYIKFQTGWQWDSPDDGLMKIVRLLNWDGDGDIFTFFSTGYSSQAVVWDLKHSETWGFRHYTSNRCDPQETNYYCDQDYDWDQIFPPVDPQPSFEESIGDGNWHHITVYTKLNTKTDDTWNHDGVNRVWVDGVLNGEKTGIQFTASDPDVYRGFNYVGIGGNSSNTFNHSTPSEQWYVIDDLTVSTEPIVGPSRTIISPIGEQPAGTTQVTLQVDTDGSSDTCTYGANNDSSGSYPLANPMTNNSAEHTATITGLQDGQSYSRNVMCSDGTEANTTPFMVSWSVTSPSTGGGHMGPGTGSIGVGTGSLATQ